MFFSSTSQFILNADGVLTDNAGLAQATSFKSNLAVNPVASGDGIYFTFDYGRFTGIREFFTDSISDTKKARPITERH